MCIYTKQSQNFPYLSIDTRAASCIIGTIVVLDDGWGYRDGDITECYMYRPWSLLVIGDHIYMGEGECYGGGIWKLSYTITDSGTGEPLRIIIWPNSYIWVNH